VVPFALTAAMQIRAYLYQADIFIKQCRYTAATVIINGMQLDLSYRRPTLNLFTLHFHLNCVTLRSHFHSRFHLGLHYHMHELCIYLTLHK